MFSINPFGSTEAELTFLICQELVARDIKFRLQAKIGTRSIDILVLVDEKLPAVVVEVKRVAKTPDYCLKRGQIKSYLKIGLPVVIIGGESQIKDGIEAIERLLLYKPPDQKTLSVPPKRHRVRSRVTR